MSPDQTNAFFEAMGTVFILNHCLTLYKDKKVRGISILSTMFFFMWGLWNITYYPSLGQIYSFYAGICVAIANFLWISLMIFYTLKEGNKHE